MSFIKNFMVVWGILICVLPVMSFSSECSGLFIEGAPDLSGHMPEIKSRVQTIWERKKASFFLTQEQAARALFVSESVFSNLFYDLEGHPWTETYLYRLARYMDVRITDLLPHDLLELFPTPRSLPEEVMSSPEREILFKYFEAVERHFRKSNTPISEDRIWQLAWAARGSFNHPQPTTEQIQFAIERAIALRALREVDRRDRFSE